MHFLRSCSIPKPNIQSVLRKRLFSTSPSHKKTYAFIGLGRMGYPMSRNLRQKLPAEDTLIVHDIRKDVVDRFCSEEKGQGGGKGCQVEQVEALEDIVGRAQTIVTMLPQPQHVLGVYSTLISSYKPSSSSQIPKLFVDSSTTDVSTSRQVSSLIPPALGTFIDAPVSGGVIGATAGTLTFMLGSPPDAVPTATHLLSLMGSRVLHCGETGSGQAAKLTNNYLLAISNAAVCEAMNLGMKLGLDPQILKNVLNTSSGKCWASEVNNPVDKCKGDFQGGFEIALMRKDLKLATQAGEKFGARMPLSEKVSEIYERAENEGKDCAGRDFSVVYRWLGGKESSSG